MLMHALIAYKTSVKQLIVYSHNKHAVKHVHIRNPVLVSVYKRLYYESLVTCRSARQLDLYTLQSLEYTGTGIIM